MTAEPRSTCRICRIEVGRHLSGRRASSHDSVPAINSCVRAKDIHQFYASQVHDNGTIANKQITIYFQAAYSIFHLTERKTGFFISISQNKDE